MIKIQLPKTEKHKIYRDLSPLLQQLYVSEKKDKISNGQIISIKIKYCESLSAINKIIALKLLNKTLIKILKNILKSNEYYLYEDQKKLFAILPNMEENQLPYVAFKIYEQIQNYGCTNHQLNFQCKIASIPYDLSLHQLTSTLQFLVSATKISRIQNYYQHVTEQSDATQNMMEMIAVELDLVKKALFNNKLLLAFQPVAEPTTQQIKHNECLIRMLDESNQPKSIGHIIPYLERLGLINLLDELVFKHAIKELTKYTKLHLAVNLSAITLDDSYLINKIIDILQNKPRIAQRLIIEITETALIADNSKAIDFIKKINQIGGKVALDDFGSGHTSFKQLQDFDIAMLKIDGSFILNLDQNETQQILVRNLIKSCKYMKIQTVAEFVETEAVKKLLIEYGIDYIQGHLIAPASTFRYWEK